MGRLDGKVALISGGARGQGATEARLFVREGAKVVFGDILDEAGKQVEAEIRAAGGEATYVHLDVTNENSWRAAVDTAVRLYGQLNILVKGIHVRRDSWVSVMYAEELNSGKSSVTLQRTDRHGSMGQKSADFQLSL